MATCARCYGTLTAHHRCSRKSFFRRLTPRVGALSLGLAAGFATILTAPRPTLALVLVITALGATLSDAVMRELRLF